MEGMCVLKVDLSGLSARYVDKNGYGAYGREHRPVSQTDYSSTQVE